jgi:hypothetical protein
MIGGLFSRLRPRERSENRGSRLLLPNGLLVARWCERAPQVLLVPTPRRSPPKQTTGFEAVLASLKMHPTLSPSKRSAIRSTISVGWFGTEKRATMGAVNRQGRNLDDSLPGQIFTKKILEVRLPLRSCAMHGIVRWSVVALVLLNLAHRRSATSSETSPVVIQFASNFA